MLKLTGSSSCRRFPVLLAFISLLCLARCAKTPKAAFSIDKTDCNAGETVTMNNTSINASSYKWTFPNGQTSTESDPQYTFPENAATGTYGFKLEVTGDKQKSASVTHSVNVKGATGRLTAWTNNNNVGQILVKIDTTVYGAISSYYFFPPACGANGCISATLSVGVHVVTAMYAGTSSSGTVNVKKDQCAVFQLE